MSKGKNFDNRNNVVDGRQRGALELGNLLGNFVGTVFNNLISLGFDDNFCLMKADMIERENEYIVWAELPGIKKDEVNIELNDNRLTIIIERNEYFSEENPDFIGRIHRYGAMVKTFYVENIRHDDVKYDFEKDMLVILLPKRKLYLIPE
jgi:HSP20 family protein